MQDFFFAADYEKAERTEDGRFFLYGCASSLSRDKQNDAMTLNALQKMATTAVGKPITRSHNNELLDRVGSIVSANIEGDKLLIKGELDADDPEAMRLFNKIDKGAKCGFSVGGKITKIKHSLDKSVRFLIDDVDFDHLMATSKPVSNDTFAIALNKALDIASAELPKIEESMTLEEMLKSDELKAHISTELAKAGAKYSADSKASLKEIHDAGDADVKSKVRTMLGDDADDVLGAEGANVDDGDADDKKTGESEFIGVINKSINELKDFVRDEIAKAQKPVEPKGEVQLAKAEELDPATAYLNKAFALYMGD